MIGHLGERVSALLDGQLSPADAEKAWAHVHACHFCRDLVEREGWIKTRLAGLSAAPDTTPDSLKGLDEFSHIDVVYVFDQVAADSYEVGARRPRGNPEWPAVGVFAQRNKRRPNRIGVCTCELLEVNGIEMTVRGLDAIDGSPVLDLKPYMTEFAPRGPVRQPRWSQELMRGYWQ